MRLAIELDLPAEAGFLAATRKVLQVYMQLFAASAEIVDDVILAMDEACSNVLKHAFPGDRPGSYLLKADLRPEEVLIEVVDEGVGFDVMAKPSRAAEGGMDVSGRGLEVMRRLMTTVEVESPTSTGGTRLRMIRRLPATGG
jgi:anti-sigma regulatory factor (Ser/Thr protein kinase)